jgi:hypothetical protein
VGKGTSGGYYEEAREGEIIPKGSPSHPGTLMGISQAKARADRSGEPIEEAMEDVLNTEAGKRLRELRDGPHGEEGVQESQVEAARERARERAEDLGERLGKAPGSPTHG